MNEIREEYLENLKQILLEKDEQKKNEDYQKLYTAYAKFCYSNNLDTYDYDLSEKSASLFVIESTPIDYEMDEKKKKEALEHLKVVLENRKKGLSDRLNEEEVEIILESVIQNARVALANQEDTIEEFFKASLDGCCGFSQALTALPLLDLGVKVTVNNTSTFPDCTQKHAFITAFFPVMEQEKIVEKQYLLDATYRQFFTTQQCNEGALYDGSERFKNNTCIDAGYYVVQSEEGKQFSKELLQKGYVELTDINARIYGYGFSCTSILLSTSKEEEKRIKGHKASEYKEAILTQQEELDYDKEELIEDGINMDLKNSISSILNHVEKNQTLSSKI